MKKKSIAGLLLAVMALFAIGAGIVGCGGNSQTDGSSSAKNSGKRLLIYTSMKESLIGGIVNGFRQKHPDIAVDFHSAGAGVLMERIAAERQNGHIQADVIWTSEVPDFYWMKQEGLLEPFRPTEFNELLNPFDDYDGSFTAARLGTLGIVINKDKVSEPPTSWEDLASQEVYKNAFGIADPTLSGTAFMSIALLEKQFGWDYIVRLRNNGASKGKGSGQVIDNTASGALAACLGVDYITASRIDKDAPLMMVYPKELLMVPSPIAIFKESDNVDVAKAFVDYVLSHEAQQKVAEAGTVPVRKDIQMPEQYHLPNPEDALKNGIHVNYAEVLSHKDELLRNFSELFK